MNQRQLLTTLLKFLGAVCVLHGGLWVVTIMVAQEAKYAGHASGVRAIVPLIELIVGVALWARFKLDDEKPQ